MLCQKKILKNAAASAFCFAAGVIFSFAESTENDTAVELAPVEVSVSRVANDTATETFAMPVTTLRFDPRVDVQGRNASEAQADISIRGGTFENTGFTIGATPIYDPQTGHYFAELPIAPTLLTAPEILTGAINARSGWNANAGSVLYAWQPVTPGGAISLGTGTGNLFTADAHVAFLAPNEIFHKKLGFDLASAYSQSDGPVSFADHEFQRHNARIQLRDDMAQTDIFAGYQTKNFAWPNLYAGRVPGGPHREEREDLRTQLYAVNHRQELNGTGDYFQGGAYYRVNKDHYSIPIFNYHARHATKTGGFGVDGRNTLQNGTEQLGATALRYRAGVIFDDLTSSELRFGNYASRAQYYLGVYGDQTLELSKTQEIIFTAGLTYEGANREKSGYSPVIGAIWQNNDTDVLLKSVRLDYAISTQLPTYTALNSAPAGFFGGDASLCRSKSRNLELAGIVKINDFEILPAVFFRQDIGLVDWVFDPANPSSNRSARAVNLDTFGLELLVRRSWDFLDLTLGYTGLARSENYTTPVTASFYALNFARHRFTAAGVIRAGYGIEFHLDNELRFQEKNALRNGTDAPFLTSIGVIWKIAQIDGLSVAVQIDNLWNVCYEEVPLVPATPRTWSLRTTYKW